VRNTYLSRIPSQELLDELGRRLAVLGGTQSKAVSRADVQGDALPVKNSALQRIVRGLRAGVQRGQPVEILKFLASNGEKPQTMAQIASHMKRLRYTATRYYDASNALVEVGLATKTQIGYDRAWIATGEGRAFLERIKS
jgi:hypothetical protein